MKRLTILLCGAIMTSAIYAQNAYDVSNALGSELNGTARYVGMGGAMGALGGDISAIGNNPAALGLFRGSDVSLSASINVTTNDSKFFGTSMNESLTTVSLDQLGFVYAQKIGNETSLRYLNWGFNYRKEKNFNRKFSMGGLLDDLSQTKQLAQDLVDWGLEADEIAEINAADNPFTKYWDRYPIMGIMGLRTGLVDDNGGVVQGWKGYNNNYYGRESGSLEHYDLSVGANIQDRFYLGATLSMASLRYKRETSYTENLSNDFGKDNGGYTTQTYYQLKGSGINLALGAVVRPVEDSSFRFGLSVKTPTWFNLRETFNAATYTDINFYGVQYDQTLSDYLNSDYRNYDYRFNTPWIVNASLGTTIAQMFAVGAEYEYQDFTSSKMKDMDGYELGDQASLGWCLKKSHTLRVGGEARIDAFSLRAGYNYTSPTFQDDAYSALSLYGVRTEFTNYKERHTATFGLGFRWEGFYADMALKYDMQKAEFHPFLSYDDQGTEIYLNDTKTTVDYNRAQLLFTVGMKF